MGGADEASGSLFGPVDLDACRSGGMHPRVAPAGQDLAGGEVSRPFAAGASPKANAPACPDAGFGALHTDFSHSTIPPERLIRLRLIRILFSVRSEWRLMEQMQGT